MFYLTGSSTNGYVCTGQVLWFVWLLNLPMVCLVDKQGLCFMFYPSELAYAWIKFACVFCIVDFCIYIHFMCAYMQGLYFIFYLDLICSMKQLICCLTYPVSLGESPKKKCKLCIYKT